MWLIMCILVLAVNSFLVLATGTGDLAGAGALGFALGRAMGLPLIVAAILVLLPQNRDAKSFLKIFFWVSVITLVVLFSQFGHSVSSSGE